MAICSYNDADWRGEICLTFNHDRTCVAANADAIGALFNLVVEKNAWWSTIEAMDGYFLDAFLLPCAPLAEPAGANNQQMKVQ